MCLSLHFAFSLTHNMSRSFQSVIAKNHKEPQRSSYRSNILPQKSSYAFQNSSSSDPQTLARRTSSCGHKKKFLHVHYFWAVLYYRFPRRRLANTPSAVKEAYDHYVKEKFEEDRLDYDAEMRVAEYPASNDRHAVQTANLRSPVLFQSQQISPQNSALQASHHWCKLMSYQNQSCQIPLSLLKEVVRLLRLWSVKSLPRGRD